MSYNIPNGGMMNGMGPQSNYGGYPQMNGYAQQMQYQQAPKPQIYTVSKLSPLPDLDQATDNFAGGILERFCL